MTAKVKKKINKKCIAQTDLYFAFPCSVCISTAVWQGDVMNVCCPYLVDEQQLGEEKGRKRQLPAHRRGLLLTAHFAEAIFKIPEVFALQEII